MQIRFIYGLADHGWWKWWTQKSPHCANYDVEGCLKFILDRCNSMTYDSSKVNDVNL